MARCSGCKQNRSPLYKHKKSGVAGRYCGDCMKGIRRREGK